MKVQAFFLVLMLLCASVCFGIDFLAQTGMQIPNVIRKRAAISESGLSAARPEISVKISGLQPGDVINLRPASDDEISAAAGTVLRTMIGDRLDPNTALIKPGGDLPQASLQVTATGVVFSRPTSVEGNAFLDLKLPGTAQVSLAIDGKLMFNAVLLKPVYFCNGEWGLGAEGVSGTLVRATGLLRQQDSVNGQPAFNKGTGLYTVSYSNVRVARRKTLAGRSGSTALVLVNVDETGKVTKATALTAADIKNLQGTMAKWQFMPYVVNGRAVPFEACVPVTVQ